MRTPILMLCSLVFFPLTMTSAEAEWGFHAHRKINHHAVFTLPPDLFGFYKQYLKEITENSVNPDKRRYAVQGEAQRHYIDIDHFAVDGQDPFDVVPKKWDDAVAKYSDDTLQAYGIIPWHIDVMVYRLTRAFQDQDVGRILRLSADLGHYVGDAHVPLHTTKNYNGQYTDQYGIHGLWESRLPEVFSDEYDLIAGRAIYVPYVLDYAWSMVEESHHALDSVLGFERELHEIFPEDQKYSFEERGRTLSRVYSRAFSEQYHQMLAGMVERRMRQTVHAIGSLWYTAWVNAGQPDLEGMNLPEDEKDKAIKELEQIDQKFRSSEKPIGRDFDE